MVTNESNLLVQQTNSLPAVMEHTIEKGNQELAKLA
jgi:hypothetical protein